MNQIPLRKIIQCMVLLVVFFALPSFPTESQPLSATISLQDGREISGALTGSRLKFRTNTESLPIAMDLPIAFEKIARYADNRLELTGIGQVDGSFVGGEFVIVTPGGEVRHAAADVVSIQLREERIVAERTTKAASQSLLGSSQITANSSSAVFAESAARICAGIPANCDDLLAAVAEAWWGEVLERWSTNQNARRSFEMLFSNPGAIASDAERLRLFNEMLEDTDFSQSLARKIDAEVLSSKDIDLPKLSAGAYGDIAINVAVSMILELAIEASAQALDAAGFSERAYWVRTTTKPTFEISAMAVGLATGATTVTAAGSSAGLIWAKNIYSLTLLGKRLNDDEAKGMDVETKLADLATQNTSIIASLTYGETRGALYTGYPTRKLTQKEVRYLQDMLIVNNDTQIALLKQKAMQDEFAWVIGAAKKHANFVAGILEKVDDVFGSTDAVYSGLESANSTPSLPKEAATMAASTAQETPQNTVGLLTMSGEVFVDNSGNKSLEKRADKWGPGIVPDSAIDLGQSPCADKEMRSCLSGLGVSEEAISFSLAEGGDLAGESFATEFVELGQVDLARISYPFSPWEGPVLLNGTPDIITPTGYFDGFHGDFPDSASRKLLAQFPKATGWISGVSGHRLMPQGGQRFILTTTLQDFCRACSVVGTAIAFLDFDANGRQMSRRNIGLMATNRGLLGQREEWSLELLTGHPEYVQYRLNLLGYDAGPMDGYPGPQTRTALMEFQAENCLATTGQPDTETVHALLRADGFNAPCSGASLPSGITAKEPLSYGMYTAPQGTMWVQVASRQNLEDARAVARQTGEGAKVFRTANGWYAITATILSEVEHENGGLDGLIATNGWPTDSLLTRGKNFVEEVAVEGNSPPRPDLTRTKTSKDSWVLSRYWRDNAPVYDRVRLAAAGERVIVWGEPDSQGDCLVDSHEGIFMKCADLAAFAAPAETSPKEPQDRSGRLSAYAQELAEIYDNDRETMRIIAEYADYAELAYLSYRDDLHVDHSVSIREWQVVDTYEEDVFGGVFSAVLFRSTMGKFVLAFRGTDSGSDWINNLGTPFNIASGQSTEAEKLVDILKERYPGLVFTGHSLGGRLAQVAASYADNDHIAVIFDSAPLSLAELTSSTGNSFRVISFRSEDDVVSGLSAKRDIEIKNFPEYDHGLVKGPFDRGIVEHSMQLLAGAMKEVKTLYPYLLKVDYKERDVPNTESQTYPPPYPSRFSVKKVSDLTSADLQKKIEQAALYLNRFEIKKIHSTREIYDDIIRYFANITELQSIYFFEGALWIVGKENVATVQHKQIFNIPGPLSVHTAQRSLVGVMLFKLQFDEKKYRFPFSRRFATIGESIALLDEVAQALNSADSTNQLSNLKLKELREHHDHIRTGIMRIFPTKEQVATSMVDLSQTGLAAGLRFNLFQPTNEIAGPGIARLPIRIRIKGTISEVLDFFDGLNNYASGVYTNELAMPVCHSDQVILADILLVLIRRAPDLQGSADLGSSKPVVTALFEANVNGLPILSKDIKHELVCIDRPSGRVREELEDFELKDLKYVGSLEQQDGVLLALITSNDGTIIHRVKRGNHIGPHEGVILEIETDRITLREADGQLRELRLSPSLAPMRP